jgi:Sulfotransferase family
MAADSCIKTHLFVSGAARSGTTLLELVLASHSMISITPETRFINDLLFSGTAKWKTQPERQELDSALGMIRADDKFKNWPGFNVEEYIQEIKKLENVSFRAMLDILFLMYARKHKETGVSIFGNKKGLYAAGYGRCFKKIFPDAKFIFIVRDPRDVVRSILKNLSTYSLKTASTRCAKANHYISSLSRQYPDDCFIVRYEDLVQQPAQQCRAMCRFLDIPFEEKMIRFYEDNENSERILKNRQEIHRNTTTPFNPDLIGQWRRDNDLPRSDIEYIEAIAGNFMSRYGYEPSARHWRIPLLMAKFDFRYRLWLRDLKLTIKEGRYV